MKIYGVALLSACFIIGKIIGSYLGKLIHVNSDVGGVGFAMLLLMICSLYLRKKGWWSEPSEQGIWFWSAMYIPIIVAMAASLNVKAAASGGWVAIIAGAAVTLLGMLCVPLLSKIGKPKNQADGDR